jgi:hypothetical protein
MDVHVFSKMKLKQGTQGRYFFAPEAYINMIRLQTYIDFEGEDPTFFHLFVTSKEEYDERIQHVLPLIKDNRTKLWISYKKAYHKKTYNINRDTFFELGKRDGLIPYSNVSLDEEWSCIGFKKAE